MIRARLLDLDHRLALGLHRLGRRVGYGDRVTVQDPDGLALNTDFNIRSIRTDFSKDSGLEQTLNVSNA